MEFHGRTFSSVTGRVGKFVGTEHIALSDSGPRLKSKKRTCVQQMLIPHNVYRIELGMRYASKFLVISVGFKASMSRLFCLVHELSAFSFIFC